MFDKNVLRGKRRTLDGFERSDIAKVLRDISGQKDPNGAFPCYVTLTGDRAKLIDGLLRKLRKLL